jgi:hypothetical protein
MHGIACAAVELAFAIERFYCIHPLIVVFLNAAAS